MPYLHAVFFSSLHTFPFFSLLVSLFISVFPHHPHGGSLPVTLVSSFFFLSSVFSQVVCPLFFCSSLFIYLSQVDISIVIPPHLIEQLGPQMCNIIINSQLKALHSFLTCVCRYS